MHWMLSVSRRLWDEEALLALSGVWQEDKHCQSGGVCDTVGFTPCNFISWKVLRTGGENIFPYSPELWAATCAWSCTFSLSQWELIHFLVTKINGAQCPAPFCRCVRKESSWESLEGGRSRFSWRCQRQIVWMWSHILTVLCLASMKIIPQILW